MSTKPSTNLFTVPLLLISLVSIGINIYLYNKLYPNSIDNIFNSNDSINNLVVEKEVENEVEEEQTTDSVQNNEIIEEIPIEYVSSDTIKLYNNIEECKEYIRILVRYNRNSVLQAILTDLNDLILETKELLIYNVNDMKHIDILAIEGLHCCGNSQLINEYIDKDKDYVVYDGQYRCHCQYLTSNDADHENCCVGTCGMDDLSVTGSMNSMTINNTNTFNKYRSILNRIVSLELNTPYKNQLLYTIQFLQYYLINIDIFKHQYKHVIIINYYHSLISNIINYNTMNRDEASNKANVEDVMYKWPSDIMSPKFVIYVAISTETRMKRMKKKLKQLGRSSGDCGVSIKDRRASISMNDQRTLNRIQKADSQLQVIYSLISLHNKELFNTIAMDGSEDLHTTACILKEICDEYTIFTTNANTINTNSDTISAINSNHSNHIKESQAVMKETEPLESTEYENYINIQNNNSNNPNNSNEMEDIHDADIFIMDDLIFDNEQNRQKKKNRRRSRDSNKRVSLGMYSIF